MAYDETCRMISALCNVPHRHLSIWHENVLLIVLTQLSEVILFLLYLFFSRFVTERCTDLKIL